MKVRELIEKLSACNPEAEVMFHEYLECEGLMDFEFSPLRHVTAGFADGQYMAGGDNEISVYEAPGKHEQGFPIDVPVVALSTQPLVLTETNATCRLLTARLPV